MAEFDPVATLRVLAAHGVDFVVVGGVAARLRGAPILTQDVDVTPALTDRNLENLVEALHDLDARLRTKPEPEGVRFPFDPDLIKSAIVWTMVTRYGDLDLVISPAGTEGYPDLIRDADELLVAIKPDLRVMVASLVDVIRSKQAAGREKDLATLPILRRTLTQLDLGED
jgi:hypothetical protein